MMSINGFLIIFEYLFMYNASLLSQNCGKYLYCSRIFFPVRNWSGAKPTLNVRRLIVSNGHGPGAHGAHNWLVEATIPRVAYKKGRFFTEEQALLQKGRLFYRRAGSFTKEQALLQKSRLFYRRAGSFTKEQTFLQKSRFFYRRAGFFKRSRLFLKSRFI